MTIQPFEVSHPDPDYVIIAFFGYDNELPENLKDHHLMEMAQGAGPDVAILAVTDDTRGPGQVFEVTSRTISLLEDLSEIDTGKSEPLAELLARGLISYPGEPRIAIGFAGHGSGIFDEEPADQLLRALGVLSNPRAQLLRSLALDPALEKAYSVLLDRFNSHLSNKEIGCMLCAAFKAAGRTAPVDLLFFDTCLNGMIEIVTEFADFAACVVASEENEPDTGWHYDKWLSAMSASPPADAAAWGGQAVKAMAIAYSAPGPSAPVTLSAVATGAASQAVAARFRTLIDAARALGPPGFRCLKDARLLCRSLGNSKYDSYDLCEFAGHVARQANCPSLVQPAQNLALAVDACVLHLTVIRAPYANGLAFWFPGNRQSYEKDVGTYRLLRFDQETGWSDYLGDRL